MARTGDHIAIVTGASRGIGRTIALCLAEGGADILVLGPKADLPDGLLADIAALGRRAVAMAGDVGNPEVAGAAVRMATRELGPVRTLVNNAGVNLRVPTLEMALEDWQHVLDVNLNGTLHFCRAVLPGMVAEGGRALLPLGGVQKGYKGFGLAMTEELPDPGLSGKSRANTRPGPLSQSVFLQVIDSEAFAGLDVVTKQSDFLADACRANPPASSDTPARVPGDAAARHRRDALANDVPLDLDKLAALNEAASRLGLAPLNIAAERISS